MKLTILLQLVDKLQKAGKIDNLQQVGGVFGRVVRHTCAFIMLAVSGIFKNTILKYKYTYILGFHVTS